MFSVSFMTAFMRALRSIDVRVIPRRVRPIRRAGRMKRGRIAIPNRVSRHSRLIMIAKVAIKATVLLAKVTIVPVTARCAPTTSLFSRDINSPARVFVKKRRLRRCRWA